MTNLESDSSLHKYYANLLEGKLGRVLETKDLSIMLEKQTREGGFATEREYLNHLSGPKSESEWHNLARELSVHETYFFRNKGHWEAFREHIRTTYFPGKKLRIWSAGCSTGEEPYTISMVVKLMQEAKVNIELGKCIASDLVPQCIQKAKEGIYAENSFRALRKTERFKFFDKEGGSYKIKESFGKNIYFKTLNLADNSAVDDFINEEGPFDIIFCRNVFIYLSAPHMSKSFKQI